MSQKTGMLTPRIKIIIPMSVLVFVFIFIAANVVKLRNQPIYGFVGRYTASTLLIQGDFGPQVYDNDWFIRQVQTIGNQPIIEIFAPNPPTLAVLTVPFVWLPPQVARNSWNWANLLLLTLVCVILISTFRQQDIQPEMSLWAVVVALIATAPANLANFRVGQVYILLLTLFTLSLWGLMSGRSWLAGAPLGLALLLKTSGLPLWALLLICRRWQALGWAIGAALTISLGSLFWIGFDSWLAYPHIVRNFSSRPAVAVTAYQTVTSFFSHLFQFNPDWNPAPIYHWPALAKSLSIGVMVVMFSFTLWQGWINASTPKIFAALLVLSIILLPVAEEYHFLLLLIPIFIVTTEMLRGQPFFRLDWLVLVIALLLIAAPINYEQPSFSSGWLALLAYPRLFGAVLVWVSLMRRMSDVTKG